MPGTIIIWYGHLIWARICGFGLQLPQLQESYSGMLVEWCFKINRERANAERMLVIISHFQISMTVTESPFLLLEPFQDSRNPFRNSGTCSGCRKHGLNFVSGLPKKSLLALVVVFSGNYQGGIC